MKIDVHYNVRCMVKAHNIFRYKTQATSSSSQVIQTGTDTHKAAPEAKIYSAVTILSFHRTHPTKYSH